MKLKTLTLSFTLALLTACSSETMVADNTTKSVEPTSKIRSLQKQYQQATEYLNTGRLDEADDLYEIINEKAAEVESPESEVLFDKSYYGRALVAYKKWETSNDPKIRKNEIMRFALYVASSCNRWRGYIPACELGNATKHLWEKK